MSLETTDFGKRINVKRNHGDEYRGRWNIKIDRRRILLSIQAHVYDLMSAVSLKEETAVRHCFFFSSNLIP